MFKLGNKDIERVHLAALDRHFYINGPIEDEDDYVDLIDALYQGKANETIVLHLNTPGGRLDITMQIINAMRVSDANVVTVADGMVASAGSLLLFASENIGISPYSYVMMHDGSEGVGGKLNENAKQVLFSQKLMRKLAFDIYKPFFSDEEIEAVLEGKDLWLMSDEVEERIKKAMEIQVPAIEDKPVVKKGNNAKKQVQE
jgi:ATP-dependent Clp protease protease subunit